MNCVNFCKWVTLIERYIKVAGVVCEMELRVDNNGLSGKLFM